MSNSERPIPRPGIMAIHAYVPGKSSAPGVAKIHKLSSNETPLGPGRKAIEAYMAEAKRLHEYPDGASTELREAIGRAFGLDPARIVCGAGSDELLNLLAHAFIGPGASLFATPCSARTARICAALKPSVVMQKWSMPGFRFAPAAARAKY